MDEAESSTRNGKRDDDRKCRGDHDPNHNGATGGDLNFSGAARGDPNLNGVAGGDPAFSGVTGGDLKLTDRIRWEKEMISFIMLKDKIAKTPILKHFDPDRPPVIVVYASKWAVSAALLQEHDGNQMKYLGDQREHPDEKRLENIAYRVSKNRVCIHCDSKKHDKCGCWNNIHG